MRIIAGKHKGRKLYDFNGDKIRPTSDKAREALFAILCNVNGLSFLDLCCGTGAIGLEAESRGAIVTMVDLSKESVALTKKNANQISSQAEIICSDAIKFLKTTNKTFDIIFSDPPYEIDLGQEIINIVEQRNLLNKNGIIIYEKDKSVDYSTEKIIKTKEKKYGKNIFGFYMVKYE